MAKLISETVKLISEMAKLISADPKSHFFGNFHCFLYYLHQTLTQNVQKSYNIGQILSKKAETHFQSIKTFFKRLKLIFKMPKLISKMPKLISQKAKTHFRGISLECPRLDCAQKKKPAYPYVEC